MSPPLLRLRDPELRAPDQRNVLHPPFTLEHPCHPRVFVLVDLLFHTRRHWPLLLPVLFDRLVLLGCHHVCVPCDGPGWDPMGLSKVVDESGILLREQLVALRLGAIFVAHPATCQANCVWATLVDVAPGSRPVSGPIFDAP